MNLKNVVESLIECFLEAGDLALQLREKGLEKKISRTHDGREILSHLQKKLLSEGLSHKLPSRHQRPEFRSAKVSTSRLKRIKDT